MVSCFPLSRSDSEESMEETRSRGWTEGSQTAPLHELAGGVLGDGPGETGDGGRVVWTLSMIERGTQARRAAAFRRHWEVNTQCRSRVGRRRAGFTDNHWQKGD
jgi:hypothetical protein